MTDIGKSNEPLSGLLVVDLTRVLAGPYCTLILADLGARVIKVEMPGTGDDSRQIGPFMEGADPSSAYFAAVNRDKESVALNLKDEDDRAIFEQLLSKADVLVENFTPGTMDKLGYGWQALHERWPTLVMTSISGFGQSGPYKELPAYDMVVQAMGGILSLTGEEGQTPTRVGVSIGDLSAGLFGVIGTQAALMDRARTGRGRHVDVAMLEAQIALLENAIARFQVEGRVPGPIGSRHPSITPFGVFKAKDASLVVAAGNDATFRRLCLALKAPSIGEDQRFLSNRDRCDHHGELRAAIEQALSADTVANWLVVLRKHEIPCGPINDVAAIMKDAHLAARAAFIDVPVGPDRKLQMARTPIRLNGDVHIRVSQGAPALDANRESILHEFVGGTPRAHFLASIERKKT